MGIQTFYQFIRSREFNIVQHKNTGETLRGARVGVDISIYLFKWCARPIVHAGRRIDHLLGLYFMTVDLLARGAVPLYVFDSRQVADSEGAYKRARAPSSVRWAPNTVAECCQMLDAFGLPYVRDSGHESDIVLAHMSRAGVIDWVISPDSDMLARGARAVIINYRTGAAEVDTIVLQDALRELGLDYPRFVEVLCVARTDYSDGLRGTSIMSAWRAVRRRPVISFMEHPEVQRAWTEFMRSVDIGPIAPSRRPEVAALQAAVANYGAALGLQKNKIDGAQRRLLNF